MSHHHFLPWLISRAWHLGRYAHVLCESAARVVQVGLRHGQRTVRFPRQRHLIASSPYEGSENQNRLNRPKRASRHIRREVIAPGRRSIPRRDNGFMITCPARSGSSMLVHLLRSHPEICAHDEVFSPDKVRGLSGKYLQRSRETRVSSSGFLSKDTEIPSDFCTNSSLIRTERRQLGLSLSMMSSSCRDMRLCGTRS